MPQVTCHTVKKLQQTTIDADHIAIELNRQSADHVDKAAVIEAIQTYSKFGMNYLKAYISCHPESSFSLAYEPAQSMLAETMQTRAFIELRHRYDVDSRHVFAVYDDGLLCALIPNWHPDEGNSELEIDLNLDAEEFSDFKNDMYAIAGLAAMTGGAVYSNNYVKVEQWLKFHDYYVPSNEAETLNLFKFLSMAPIESPPLGNYWELLSPPGPQPFSLTDANKANIREVTLDLVNGPNRLLQTLSRGLLHSKSADYIRNNADALLQKMVSSEAARQWSQEYLDALGWYGAHEGESVDVVHLDQLLLTALLLDQTTLIDTHLAEKHIAGYNLYSPDNVEKSLQRVRIELEYHLVATHQYPDTLAPLIAHLLLAGNAPEFLVKDAPSSLLLGTEQWVDFRQGVCLAELNAAGSSRVMTFPQLQILGQIQPVTPSQESIHGLIASEIIMDWALLHGAIDQKDLGAPEKTAFATALKAFRRNADLLAEAAQTLASPMPTRREAALKMLQHAAPAPDFLQKEVLYLKKGRGEDFFNEPLAMSMLDLHMSNDLGTQEWDVRKPQISVYQRFPKLLSNLASPHGVFDIEFKRAHKQHENAVATTLKLAMAALPQHDRNNFQRGKINVFTIRPSVVKQDKRPNLPVHPILAMLHPDFSILPRHPDPVENQRDKDAATGRYGVLLGVEVDNQFYCYELFTLYGECRKNQELAKLIIDNNLLNMPSRLAFTGNLTTYTAPTTLYELPLNVESYTHGVQPESGKHSKGVIERLGSIAAPSVTEHYASSYQSFYSPHIQTIADFVVKHRPFVTGQELHADAWGQTKWEEAIQKSDDRLATLVNIIVPFKACIADLSSDDADRKLDATSSCSLEVVGSLFMVVGAAAKLASIAAKSASAAAKAANLARAASALVISAVNPLDGVPELITGGFKLLGKGAWRLSKAGQELLDSGTDQLRRLINNPTRELIEATRHMDMSRGTWKAMGQSGETSALWAVRNVDDWYALNLRTGKPWGPRLTALQRSKMALSRVWLKLMPDSFAFSYVRKSLPIAQQKIDTALAQLLTQSDHVEIRSLLKSIFGDDSTVAATLVSDVLTKMRKDMSHVSIKNIHFEKIPNEGALAEMYIDRFAKWKAGNYQSDAFNSKFMTIYTAEMSDYFQTTKFDRGRIADGIVHEMSHGSQHTADLMYAGLRTAGEVDVNPLMNLAAHPWNSGIPQAELDHFMKIKASLPGVVSRHPALLNADSYAVAVSLLNQRSTNPPLFIKNLLAMELMRAGAGTGLFKGSVIVDLSTLA
ncbi:hypothetical protein [Pseudomonas frederiksbergensis]|uniref:Dermonecrotic toxin n=1 Tax=Pseudomonas frederiksbergensis TaxID=104087 RepID=A0A6L5C2M3_9PSED|nr:hypothetical protein [Pseudomonas frederiksbergensis]KAF2395049.1 hypothetical protein FX983_03032 [Pseudomonas frederiksbergensis]